MAKERNYNPVQAQRKAEKAKAIRKGKADVAASRNERLAKKNPERIRNQIQDLKAITEGGGRLTSHEEQVLEGLEKELKAVDKARQALGDRAPTFGRSAGGSGPRHGHNRNDVLGKRRRRDGDDSSSESDVPEDIRRIPMPRDTPPPIPKDIIDEWYAKRRARRDANKEPLGDSRSIGRGEREGDTSKLTSSASSNTAVGATTKPIEVKTVYEAKPVIRDLQKEAVTTFMPTVVRRKLDKSRGMGGLLEPEEADQLEREGYLKSSVPTSTNTDGTKNGDGGSGNDSGKTPLAATVASVTGRHHVTVEDVSDDE